MKSFITFFAATMLVLLSGCSGTRYLESTKSAELFLQEGNYSQALEVSEEIISDIESRNKIAPGNVYALAGASAWELEKYNSSLEYLIKAQEQEYTGEEMYFYLARNYRRIDNLSKEITALETYMVKYPAGEHIREVRERLFRTCLESENFTLGDELWVKLDSMDREKVSNLEVYLKLNSNQGNNSLSDSLGEVILGKDPENESALKWIGEKLFWRAENTYLAQMKAYKENRTHKQYAILLEAFKQVNADFKKSLDYFQKLYRLYPNPEYANYLANIYMRLEDDEKAAYYKKRAS